MICAETFGFRLFVVCYKSRYTNLSRGKTEPISASEQLAWMWNEWLNVLSPERRAEFEADAARMRAKYPQFGQ